MSVTDGDALRAAAGAEEDTCCLAKHHSRVAAAFPQLEEDLLDDYRRFYGDKKAERVGFYAEPACAHSMADTPH